MADIDEASLDDFFQPPADEPPPAPRGAGSMGKGRAAAADIAPFEEDFGSPMGAAQPAGASQVEALPITDLGAPDNKKKKMLIIGGAAAGVLILLALLYFFVFSGEEAPPPPPPPPVAKVETPPPPPPPAPKLERLSDLERAPKGTRTLLSAVADTQAGGLSADGKTKLGGMKGKFTLYVGAFVVPGNLEKGKEKVRAAGLTPTIRESKADVTMHRLFAKEETSGAAARATMQKLKAAGFDAFIIKLSPGTFHVFAGSFFTQAKADEYQKRLTAAGGYTPRLTTATVKLTIWELFGGSFDDLAKLEPALSGLVKQGLETDIVSGG